MLRLLFERGEGELAVKLLTSKKTHTYAEMRARGATTLFEHWPDSWRDRSHNHPMLGASVSHLYDYLLGIRQIQTANGEHLVIAPVFTSHLSRVSGWRTVKKGRVAVSYEKKGDAISLTIELPEGALATLRVGEWEFALPQGGVIHHELELEAEKITPADGEVICVQAPLQKAVIQSIRTMGSDRALAALAKVKENGKEHSFPRGVRFYAPNAKKFELSEDPDFLVPFPTQFKNGYYEAINLKAGTAYYWRENGGEIHTFRTTKDYPRFIHIDGAMNVRDLGSEKIKQGLVYRGTDIDRNFPITAAGKKTFCDQLGIKTELDLRLTSAEKNYRYSAAGSDVKLAVLPYRPYNESFEPINRARLIPIMELFADESAYPIYMHCMGGADRTGIIALFLEALCGESDEHIHLDFELTGLSNYGAAVLEGATDSMRSRNSPYYRDFLEKLSAFAPGKTLAAQTEAFLLDCGVSRETIKRIRAILMK